MTNKVEITDSVVLVGRFENYFLYTNEDNNRVIISDGKSGFSVEVEKLGESLFRED